MTRHERFDTKDISESDLVLATDLDGTLLGGTDAQRRQFYDWIDANRARVGLIYVTGRDPGFIRDLTRKGDAPRPDYVVADVGTTIASAGADHMLSPISELEAPIADAWGDAGGRVHAALHHAPGLRLQSTGFRHRASYDLDPESFDDAAIATVEAMGLDALISANRYFDVLPKGVSKGPSLLSLLSHLGVRNDRVLVAGDTLNDLSMLTLGLPSVAVGNSEPALLSRVATVENVYRARGHGVEGIAEAIVHLNLLAAT